MGVAGMDTARRASGSDVAAGRVVAVVVIAFAARTVAEAVAGTDWADCARFGGARSQRVAAHAASGANQSRSSAVAASSSAEGVGVETAGLAWLAPSCAVLRIGCCAEEGRIVDRSWVGQEIADIAALAGKHSPDFVANTGVVAAAEIGPGCHSVAAAEIEDAN